MSARLDALAQQQALQSDGVLRMLQGQWQGFPSLEADVLALSPGVTLTPKPPYKQSEVGPSTPPWWLEDFQPNAVMPRQAHTWSCAAAALAWVLRATRVDPTMTEELAITAIGYPDNINPTYGLMDGSGSALRAVYDRYSVPTSQAWLTFDEVYAAAGSTTGQMSGRAWYHWVGIRGQGDGAVWIANSAPGYRGAYESLIREQFETLGPFSVVLLG